MIQNYFDNVKRILGSLISNARAREGWGKGIYLFSFLKIIGSPAKRAMRAGKKKRGSGGNEFLPARSVWGGKRFRNSALAEYQNRKIFVFLIEKSFWGARLKNVKKIFLFCSPSGGRKRWAGLSPAGRQSKVGVGILFKIGSDFVQKVPPIYNFGVLRRHCLALASLGLGICDDFIRIFEIQKQFLPAQTEVRRTKHGQNRILQTNLFSFAFGERQSDNFKYFDCPIRKI